MEGSNGGEGLRVINAKWPSRGLAEPGAERVSVVLPGA